ncbi:hypothetical protein B0O99DRAFT_683884 [Bisporella sp. PMI_857]|nr:hypothetical protein B0O99DRAFT_683884 [Bisporella sp. PMI_857]
MTRISYPTGQVVPPWSWMARDGQIIYVKVEFEQVEWNKGVQWTNGKLKAPVVSSHNCSVELGHDGTYVIEDEKRDDENYWLKDDEEDQIGVQELKYAIIGRKMSN